LVKKSLLPFLIFLITGCACTGQSTKPVTGAERLDVLLPMLAGKKVGMLVNHTATVGGAHLADTLIRRGIAVRKIYSPEHGFRGTADAGEHVKDGVDPRTGVPVISLYGSSSKPSAQQLEGVDVVLFDIQDVGARFFTYISSLHYMMEACAENGKKLVVLDRPNPNGNYVDGPLREEAFRSFVGMHPVPVVHGMTVGEYAKMVNGEGWLANGIRCDLEVVAMKGYMHSDTYHVPLKPSPNLPNDAAITLYPSVCLFEGTVISVGRGTDNPFQIAGHPSLTGMTFTFTPRSIEGMAKTPPLEGKLCYGKDFRVDGHLRRFTLSYLIEFYKMFPEKDKFFNSYFEKIAGTADLREQIQSGMSEEDIRKTWQPGLEAFRKIRATYLLYP
jgi:uncharacterized protein YbbC (DUF1343 family)